MPLIALGIAGAVTGIGGAVASTKAAGAQADAAKSAAELQHEDQQASLAFQQNQFNTQQANMAPWISAGQGAISNLSSLAAPGGLPAWNQEFQAPTAEQAAQTPGYQFQLQQGQQALENSAAARGGLLSTGTAKALDQYSQGLASSNYQQTYNNAMQQYLQSYNQFQTNQANQFNRLASVAGMGQTSTAQAGQLGQQAASNVANINSTAGAQQGQSLQNAGAATASGYVGAANSASGALNNFGQSVLLNSLINPPSANTLPTGPNQGIPYQGL